MPIAHCIYMMPPKGATLFHKETAEREDYKNALRWFWTNFLRLFYVWFGVFHQK